MDEHCVKPHEHPLLRDQMGFALSPLQCRNSLPRNIPAATHDLAPHLAYLLGFATLTNRRVGILSRRELSNARRCERTVGILVSILPRTSGENGRLALLQVQGRYEEHELKARQRSHDSEGIESAVERVAFLQSVDGCKCGGGLEFSPVFHYRTTDWSLVSGALTLIYSIVIAHLAKPFNACPLSLCSVQPLPTLKLIDCDQC